MAPKTSLTASFASTPDELVVDYTLTNTSGAGLYVLDVAIAVEAGGTQVVHRPRVELHPGQQLLLVNRLTPPDRRRSYAIPPTAYAALLAAGATRSVHVALPLPLAPANLVPTEHQTQLELEKVALIVGVVPATAVPSARQVEIGGQPLWQLPMDAVKQQIELRADGVAAKIRVFAPR